MLCHRPSAPVVIDGNNKKGHHPHSDDGLVYAYGTVGYFHQGFLGPPHVAGPVEPVISPVGVACMRRLSALYQ